jgi:hypothetical protein
MNKIEEYKKEKDGLDILGDVPRYAVEGWEATTKSDKEWLKWAELEATVSRWRSETERKENRTYNHIALNFLKESVGEIPHRSNRK